MEEGLKRQLEDIINLHTQSLQDGYKLGYVKAKIEEITNYFNKGMLTKEELNRLIKELNK